MYPVPPPLPPTRSTSDWWQRYWPWVIPAGCLTLLVLFAGFVFGIYTMVTSLMRTSIPYQVAVQRAEGDMHVTAALGTPVTEGWLISGSINVANSSGHANLVIPIKGPRGKGTIYVVANKSGGVWNYETLQARVGTTGEVIDLHQRNPSF